MFKEQMRQPAQRPEGYFTFSFLPARMLEPLMPFSFLSLSTVVWFLRAISESVWPSLIVTLWLTSRLPLPRLPFLE